MTEKESEARKLINDLRGDGFFEFWSAEEVFEFLEDDGFEWNAGEWVVTSRPAWNGFDDVDLVPTLKWCE